MCKFPKKWPSQNEKLEGHSVQTCTMEHSPQNGTDETKLPLFGPECTDKQLDKHRSIEFQLGYRCTRLSLAICSEDLQENGLIF